MKRLFVFTIFVLLFVNSYGVTRETAQKVAETFFKSSVSVQTRSFREPIKLLSERYTDEPDAPFYIFGFSGGGFVIVSGFKSAMPILGYSFTNKYDEESIPLNAHFYLDWLARVIQSARDTGMEPSPYVSEAWANYLGGLSTMSNPVVLETAQWGQREPFNDRCPIVDGEHCVTGCVNTAAAIVMRYHKWPSSGTGYLPDYDSNRHYEGHSLGHSYDWDNMPLRYIPGEYSEEQASQVSQLMYDIGIMNQVYYDLKETTGSIASLFKLITFFSYASTMTYMSKDSCTPTQWISTIKTEIDEKRPVIYSGAGSGAHAWVIDGYQDDFVRMNFGWSGMDNAFYSLYPLGEDTFIPYEKSQNMLIGIKPKEQSLTFPLINKGDLSMNYLESWAWDYSGKPFNMATSYDAVFNLSPDSYLCDLAIGLVREDGTIKEIISDSSQQTIDGYSYAKRLSIKCAIHSSISIDDTIQICCKDSSGEWVVVPSVSIGGIFRMVHDKPLRSLCSITYEKEYVEDGITWKRASVFLPVSTLFKVTDETGVMLNRDALTDHSGGQVPFGNVVYRIKRLKGAKPKKFIIRLYDMRESFSFDVTF